MIDTAKYQIHIEHAGAVAIGDGAQVLAATQALAPPSRADLLSAIHRANAYLRMYRNTIASIHLDRPEVDEIVAWATGADEKQRLGVLLDMPGGGKTVMDQYLHIAFSSISVLMKRAYR